MPAARRRPRSSDEQTARRVLDAALAQVAADGIGVGLDRVGFEDAIRAADVSRASAYRRWPTREAFAADVLVELARGSEVPGLAAPMGDRLAAVVTGADPAAWQTAAGRRDVVVELLRVAFQADLEAAAASATFRGYLALRAAFAGLDDEALRARVAAELAVGERRAVARGATILSAAAELTGMRLAPPLAGPEGFALVARGVAAASVGFVVSALTDPAVLDVAFEVAAHGSSSAAEWSVPAFVLTGLVLGACEPDPAAPARTRDELVTGIVAAVAAGQEAADAVAPRRASGS
jgi:AcrR family transcriptional regulator